MALDSYSALLASIASWLHRPDLASQCPDFVTLAETQMNRRLRVRPMVTREALTVSAEFTDLPSDFLVERTLTLASTPPVDVEFANPDILDQTAWPQQPAGIPQIAAVVGTQLRVNPVPDQAYSGHLTYFAKIPPLATNPTNWLLAAHPDVYLYGALTQSAPFLRDDARVDLWGGLFKAGLDDIQAKYGERSGRLLTVDAGLRPRRPFNIQIGDYV